MKPPSQQLAPWLESLDVPILGPESSFPEHYAVHALSSSNPIKADHLLSSDLRARSVLTDPIDHYLGTTKYVFFSLGKGYLKSRDSWGLIYDPFVVAQTPGANIVLNDLIYLLDQSHILPNFCLRHQDIILQLLRRRFHNILQTLHQPLAYNTLETLFLEAIHHQRSLIETRRDPRQRLAAISFEIILPYLPASLSDELAHEIQQAITKPHTIAHDLESTITDLFHENPPHLHTFSDHLTEERVAELRVPHRHPLKRGLIAVYTT